MSPDRQQVFKRFLTLTWGHVEVLAFAPAALTADATFMLAAAARNVMAVHYAAEALKESADFILSAAELNVVVPWAATSVDVILSSFLAEKVRRSTVARR